MPSAHKSGTLVLRFAALVADAMGSSPGFACPSCRLGQRDRRRVSVPEDCRRFVRALSASGLMERLVGRTTGRPPRPRMCSLIQ